MELIRQAYIKMQKEKKYCFDTMQKHVVNNSIDRRFKLKLGSASTNFSSMLVYYKGVKYYLYETHENGKVKDYVIERCIR